jgi:hypothetical protein
MNKPFVRITHDYLGALREKNSNDASIYILGAFLTSDVGDDISGWKELALYDISAMGGGNFSDMYVVDGKIRIQEQFEERGKSPFIELTKEEFLHVLDEWEKAYQKDTKEILITREDNSSFSFEVKK